MGKIKEALEKEKELRQQLEFDFYDGTGNPQQAAARQVGGSHYKNKKFQVWDIINEYELNYYLGNAIKYILRNKSNKAEDIAKAIHYLEYYNEKEESK
jgi:hypothetical protein